jgi:hypothetical protein
MPAGRHASRQHGRSRSAHCTASTQHSTHSDISSITASRAHLLVCRHSGGGLRSGRPWVACHCQTPCPEVWWSAGACCCRGSQTTTAPAGCCWSQRCAPLERTPSQPELRGRQLLLPLPAPRTQPAALQPAEAPPPGPEPAAAAPRQPAAACPPPPPTAPRTGCPAG